jgi:lipoprotein-anchoring transpeptidase ErfK/SrfK
MTSADPAAFQEALARGLDALARGNLPEAGDFALRAVRADPLAEEGWLLLAAAVPAHRRRAYLEHLLAIHPGSENARQALDELERESSLPSAKDSFPFPSPREILASADAPETRPPDTPPSAEHPGRSAEAARMGKPAVVRRGFRWGALVVSISCVLALTATAFAGAVTYAQEPPVVARVVRERSAVPPTFTPSATSTITPSFTPTYTATFTPSPTYTPTDTLPPTNTPIPDAYIIPGAGGERWVDVDISSQSLTAYEGSTPVRTFIVSTGTAAHPTVLGRYRVYVKYRYDDMAGPGYYLPNVPFVQYFYQGYSIHGTYWHHNFGTPMSHGCINMYTPDAEWMYYFTSIGTLVNVHW